MNERNLCDTEFQDRISHAMKDFLPSMLEMESIHRTTSAITTREAKVWPS